LFPGFTRVLPSLTIKPPPSMRKLQIDRNATQVAIENGYDFLYRCSRLKEASSYEALLTCCFALVASTSEDVSLRRTNKKRALELSSRWRRKHRKPPRQFNQETVLDFIFVCYALRRLGKSDRDLEKQTAAAIEKCSVQDLLGFDPQLESPPNDLSYVCQCGLQNRRGRKFCSRCRKKLLIKSRYRAWMEGLANTYVAEQCDMILGCRYADLLKWISVMRPYPKLTKKDKGFDEWVDALYAVTHVVYTLNDYGAHRLRSRLLAIELDFLRSSVAIACRQDDYELLGELLDSLKGLGLSESDPLIVRGTKCLLESVNDDGSWGDYDANIRSRCHTTWTAIDGLRSHSWLRARAIHKKYQAFLK